MSNEEKILEILGHHDQMFAAINQTLEKHGEMLEKHGEMLERHGEMLERHGETLEKHSKILEEHSKILEQHSQILEEHSAELKKHGELLEKLDERSQRTAVLMETEVTRKLDLLYEGHGAIMDILETLAPKSRVEGLEDDVRLLKIAFKSMQQDIAGLKKAQ